MITKHANRTTSPNVYAIQILAYDSSGNASERSAAVTGVTVDPVKPSKPTAMSVTAPAGSGGELVVSWQAPTDGTATAGYRLYRSTTQFASPGTAAIPGSLLIASENTLTAETTSYTDTGLPGCTEYYYALAAVNCDETLVATYRYNDDASLSDYAAAHNDGSTTPLDTTPPPPPILAGSQGWQGRALLTLTNPLEAGSADFTRTTIEWKKSTTAFALIPQSDYGVPVPGNFKNRGSQVVDFDREVATNAAQSLELGATYTFRAVSYDRCNNPSASSPADFLNIGIPACTDTPSGAPHLLFSVPRYYSCQPGTVDIAWEYSADLLGDFAGFRIQRTKTVPATTDELTGAGLSSRNAWSDAGPLQEGAEYRYSVTATDCLGQPGTPMSIAIPSASDYLYPGRLRRYQPLAGVAHELDPENFVTTISDASAPYTYHNNVKFFLQNTSRSPMRIKQLAVAWKNPNVVLHSISVGGAAPVSAGSAVSGEVFSVNAEVAAVADALGSPSAAIPVVLRFTTPAGVVNSLTDMRNERLTVSLWAWNKSLQDVPLPRTRSARDRCAARSRTRLFFTECAGRPRDRLLRGGGRERHGPRHRHQRLHRHRRQRLREKSAGQFPGAFSPTGSTGGSKLNIRVYTTAATANLSAVPIMPTPVAHFERQLQTIGGDRYAISDSPSPPVAARN